MKGLELIRKRRSVRQFAARPVARKALEKIVDAGRFAATARNVQPWEFVVVTQKEQLSRIAGITDHGKFISAAAACIVVFCSETKYYLEDGCAATQNILLAATELGVGSCWVAGDKKPYSILINDLLAVPAAYKLVSIIPLGYPAGRGVFVAAAKRPLKELMHWEKF